MGQEKEYGPRLPTPVEILSRARDRQMTARHLKLVLPQMRQEISMAGVNLEPGEEVLKSLSERQFRSLDSGRGLGMVAVLGRERAEELVVLCQETCINGPRIGSNENSRGRGMMQMAADLVQLLIKEEPGDEEVEAFVLKTNQRVKKGTKWTGYNTPKEVKQRFESVPDPEGTIASVPYDAMPKLWQFLCK